MTDQPAVPEEKCPKCHQVFKEDLPDPNKCSYCGRSPSIPPSVGELGPDTVIGEVVFYPTGSSLDDSNERSIDVWLEHLKPEYQAALLRKGGLDREKLIRWMDMNVDSYYHEGLRKAIESGALDVTPDNEGKGGGK